MWSILFGWGQGGILDERSEVFDKILDIIIEQAWRGTLVWFAIENSNSIVNLFGNDTRTFADRCRMKLRASIPFFRVDVEVSDVHSVLPQRRRRAWIRGLREDTLNGLPFPKPLVFQTTCTLEELLDASVPNIRREDLTTDRRKQNLDDYTAMLAGHIAAGTAHGRMAFSEIDRATDRRFSCELSWDAVPSLRTGGPDFFIVSVFDANNPDVMARKCHRFLSDRERFLLQGYPAEYSNLFRSPAFCRSATGNCYAVPMLAAMVLPLVRQVGLSQACRLSEAGISNLIADAVRQQVETGMRAELKTLNPEPDGWAKARSLVLESRVVRDVQERADEAQALEDKLIDEAIMASDRRSLIEKQREEDDKLPKDVALEKLALNSSISRSVVVMQQAVSVSRHQAAAVEAEVKVFQKDGFDDEEAMASLATKQTSFQAFTRRS